MSEFREDLLISPINKKRIIGIFLITALLISLFAFSVLLYSLLFGSQRPFPSDQLSEAEYEEGNPVFFPLPQDLLDLFDDLNLTQDQLQDILDSLQDMFDGDIDDLDLGNFSQSILSLLASEIEVFRVFYYSDINAMTNKLWKYECFDEYTGDGWHSTASTQSYSYYSYNDWLTYHSDKDLLKIKMPLTPTLGINSMVAPTLFPNPYVIDGSIFAPNMVLTPPDEPKLYKDDFNSTTMDLTFTSEADVNMSYYMFGLNLPSNDDINNSAVEALYTPPVIQNRYLQLPLTLDAYLTNNYFVNENFIILNNTINEYDNAFVVANKIRNYLQTYFTFPIDPDSYNPAPPGRDTVDWFCETRQGVWSDFASAFCIFCRIFGVASRFVDGFNSFGIQEMFDPFEGANGFAIKYKNLYNWAEIYIPSDYLGNGQWVQMDIIFDSFGAGGSPVTGGDYNISVYTDQPFPAVYYRPDIANITAYLSSITEPIDNIGITFRDVSSGELLGIDYTDINGQASILVNINDSKVVGHHLIEARVNPVIANYTLFTIPGDIEVELTLVSPTMVNRSDTWPDITNVTGYVYDPVANKRVKDAEVNFKLLQYGTNNEIFNAFIPSTQFTDPNGEFSEILNVNPSVPAGQYEIRVDFNGTWMLPLFYVPFTSIVPITNSSQRWEFNITKALSLYFYINSFPANDPNNPLVFRDDPLILTARVMLENVGPVQGKRVFFHDWTRGGIELGSDISDVNGFASITIPANNSYTAGPNLLFARYRMQENFSYFILNEEPTLFAIGPSPREINRTGSGNSNTIFNIQGDITDSTNGNPLHNCELRLRLLRGGLDYSSYLIPSEYFWSRFDGSFDWNFEVASNTPIGNYTLRIDFNGTLDYSGHPIYPHFFNLPLSDLETSYLLPNELSVSSLATLSFNFWINGTTSYDYNQPIINYNDHLDLSVYLTWGGAPIGDGEPIDFYDVTQDFFIGTAFTNLGFAQILYSTDFFTIAGPHQIYARWGSYYNFSYFILDEQIVVDFESGPVPREISRGQTIFNLHGYVNDSFNRSPIKYAEISVHLYDLSETEVFGYLIHESGSLQLDDTGEFDLYYSVSGSTPDQNYTIKVEFNGIFLYSYPPSNNPYDFFLFLPNFYDIVNASHQLKVNDPDNLDIYLAVEGNPTLPFYDNGNPPETYGFGDVAHIQVTIVHIEDIFNREVRIYDDYDNTLLNFSIFTIHALTGFVQFNIPTINFHAGLNRLRVEYHSFATINITYVVVNETFTITPSPTWYSVLRNFDSFYLNTYVQDGTIDLNGLEITILLLNSTFNDVSFYLNIAGPQTITVYNGYYQFNINSINLNCPEGQYYLIIEFYGNIFDTGVSLFNYMGYQSSSLIPINVSAGTTLSGNYDTRVVKDQFYEGDDLYAYGYLRWDNGTEIAFKEVNVTIRDSIGNIITSATGFTDINGFFNITIIIGAGWPDNAEVWVSFYPEDNFAAPRYYFIKSSEQQLFRP